MAATSDHELGGYVHSRVEIRDGATRIGLSGQLNEAAKLRPLTKLATPLVIDLSKLDRINSIGVRMWMDFVRDCEAAGLDLTFERCSPAIVGQISMIRKFMGTRSRVASVLVPYLCQVCQHEELQLLELTPNFQVQLSMPCPKCRAPMEIDDLVETYTQLAQYL